MPLDTSIALNANAPAPVNPLQTALQVAQFRAYNANGLQAQQSLAANRAISSAYQQATDPTTGKVDNNKLMGIISQDPDAANKLGEVVQSINTQKQQEATLDGTRLDQAQKAQGALRSGMGSLLTKPDLSPGDIQGFVGTMVKAGAIPQQVADAELQSMPQDPAQIRPWLAQHFNSALSGEQQLSNMKPNYQNTDSGPAILGINNNANAIGPNGQQLPVGSVGYAVQKGLDPGTASTPTQYYDPADKTPKVGRRDQVMGGQPPPIPTVPGLGAGAGGGAGQAAPLPSGPAPGAPGGMRGVPTGPAMGVADSNQGNVDVVNNHWKSVGADAQNAQTNIGIAQNIKAYAEKALTGKQGDKLAAVNGILSIFGEKGQTDLNTATDLLKKNMARLNLTSRQGAGGTDAAGAMASAANPNGTMSADAIKEAADQVIGAQKMALSQQQLLQPYKLNNDVAGYQSTLSKFNQAADPRVWQFQSMTPEQRASFKAGMSPADQKAFSNKIRTLEGMGAIQ